MKTLVAIGIFSGALVSCGEGASGQAAGAAGGATQTLGGTNSSGGTVSGSGGSRATGGTTASNLGGSTVLAASGGSAAVGSTGGSKFASGGAPTGGNASTGGSKSASGGALTGGNASTGGTKAASGGAATGGTSSTGGSNPTGGATTGGNPPTGGSKATGGSVATGGMKATGGSSSTQLGCTSSDATYKLVWSDEFNGAAGAAVDSSKWTYDVGGNGWGNNELEYYTSGNANAAMDGNGDLVITAKSQSMNGMNYTSARLKTLGLASWTYGRIEARIKIPKGQGIWPAFWLLGIDINSNPWPACGEIDVFENIGKEPNIIHGSVHGPGYSGASGPTAQTSLSAPVGDAFHVFAIEWEQSTIRWYVDGTLYSTKTQSSIPAGSTWAFSHPFFILLNVAVGGGWPGNPDGTTTFPQQMVVDYVRVCQH